MRDMDSKLQSCLYVCMCVGVLVHVCACMSIPLILYYTKAAYVHQSRFTFDNLTKSLSTSPIIVR